MNTILIRPSSVRSEWIKLRSVRSTPLSSD